MANIPVPAHFQAVNRILRAAARFSPRRAPRCPGPPARGARFTPHPAVDPLPANQTTSSPCPERLERSHVAAVFLSDDKDDHKAVVVTQADDKITFKVPEVKPGDYNISIQSGNAIFIQPVRFTVQ